MVVKELIISFIYSSLLRVSGQLSIIQSPASVEFSQTSALLQSSELPQVIFNLFGLPNSQITKWDGLLVGNLFKRPKAVVVVSMTTEQPIPLQQPIISFNLTEDTTDFLDVEYVARRLQALTWNDAPLLVDASVDKMLLDVKSSYDEISSTQSLDSILDDLKSSHWLENHPIGSLSIQSDNDLLFLGEVAAISKTIAKIKETKLQSLNSPCFLSFHISSLPSISSRPDAHSILLHVLREASVQLNALFEGNVAMATLVTSPGNTNNNNNNFKLGRQLQQAGADSVGEPSEAAALNPAAATTSAAPTTPTATPAAKMVSYRAPKYSEDYAAIFNIVLWSSIVISLALLSISWSIWHMDPGKDSVIYRMTTQRLKRD